MPKIIITVKLKEDLIVFDTHEDDYVSIKKSTGYASELKNAICDMLDLCPEDAEVTVRIK